MIHAGEVSTRSALTAALGVTRATAGAVTAELHALRLIQVATGTGGGRHGRPSHRLLIDPDGPVTIAAEVQPDGFGVALVGLGGRIVARQASQADVPGDPAYALAPVAAAAARLVRRTGLTCVGAALAVASAVAQPEGAAVSALYLGWPTGSKIRDIFAELLAGQGITDVTCVAANDINAVALAEHRHGAGKGAANLLVVASGHRGVGGALVLGGALYTGSTGLGMEAGHVSVDPNGHPCPCGNRGCLSVETDAERFLAAARRAPRVGPRVGGPRVGGAVLDQAIAVLRAGYGTDPRVRAAAATFIEHLGLGLAGLINVLNPDRILLGGLHKHLLEAAPDMLRSTVAERSPWGRGAAVPLLPCALDDGCLIGAAELAWQPVLDDPATLYPERSVVAAQAHPDSDGC
jgi:predicted NBD/HSP70 family sugar kinase